MALFKRRPRGSARGTRLFFATDLHGSDTCFRKFLNAARFYDVETLICGGDLTGKMLIPIRRLPGGGWSARYGDERHDDLDRAGLDELRALIRRAGHYPVIDSADELAALEDEGHRERVFRRVVMEAVADWVALAEERLSGTGVKVYIAPGNDDFFDIDAALRGSEVVVFAENTCLRLDDEHEMITTGFSNPTPWQTERELPEPELRKRLDSLTSAVRDPANLVAVVHPPPYDSELDTAPALDAELRMTMESGAVKTAPVGSTAVRGFIEDVQPLLALHGHVHESAGAIRIGRTLCLNPGSDYVDGVLNGALVELGDERVIANQFVSG